MESRYHPIKEGLKINEDGTEITLNGKPMLISEYQLPDRRIKKRLVSFGTKRVSVIRLVCEAWIGLSPSYEHAARRIDEEKGDHYSNLYWGKVGMTISSKKGVIKPCKKMSLDIYNQITEESKNSSIAKVLRERNISEGAFYQFRNKHVNKK